MFSDFGAILGIFYFEYAHVQRFQLSGGRVQGAGKAQATILAAFFCIQHPDNSDQLNVQASVDSEFRHISHILANSTSLPFYFQDLTGYADL
jgi:hypothetical protein